MNNVVGRDLPPPPYTWCSLVTEFRFRITGMYLQKKNCINPNIGGSAIREGKHQFERINSRSQNSERRAVSSTIPETNAYILIILITLIISCKTVPRGISSTPTERLSTVQVITIKGEMGQNVHISKCSTSDSPF